jgi:hypothetical protein
MKNAQPNTQTQATSNTTLQSLSHIFKKIEIFRTNKCTHLIFYQPNAQYLVGEIKTEYTDQKIYGIDNLKKIQPNTDVRANSSLTDTIRIGIRRYK